MIDIENTVLLLLLALTSTGMCLPIDFLGMSYSGFQASCHNMYNTLDAATLEGKPKIEVNFIKIFDGISSRL
jgi:hypothetical protein